MSDFPIQIPFKLGKVKNNGDWSGEYQTRLKNLVDLIRNSIESKSNFYSISPPYNTSADTSEEYNILHVEADSSKQFDSTFLLRGIPNDSITRKMYYLVIDSNYSTLNFNTEGIVLDNESPKSFNRSLYVLRKLDKDTIIVLKHFTDVYVPDPVDFEGEDFLDWDIISG